MSKEERPDDDGEILARLLAFAVIGGKVDVAHYLVLEAKADPSVALPYTHGYPMINYYEYAKSMKEGGGLSDELLASRDSLLMELYAAAPATPTICECLTSCCFALGSVPLATHHFDAIVAWSESNGRGVNHDCLLDDFFSCGRFADVWRLFANHPSGTKLYERDQWIKSSADVGDPDLVGDLSVENPNMEDFDESIALYAAASTGNLELVKLFLSHDGNIATPSYGPLFDDEGFPMEGQILLFVRDVEPWSDTQTTTIAAAENGHKEVVCCLLDWLETHPRREHPSCSLFAAVHLGLLDRAAECIVECRRSSHSFEDEDPLRHTLNVLHSHLSVAATRADVDMVRTLLRAGADARQAEGTDCSPVYCASRLSTENSGNVGVWERLNLSGHEETTRRKAIVRLLVQRGATAARHDDEVKKQGCWRQDRAYDWGARFVPLSLQQIRLIDDALAR